MLSKEKVYKGIIDGAQTVINNEDNLNAINVFPVNDKDTGTNLVSLMGEILKTSRLGNTLKETFDSISDAALIGSRGNSGIIFSQFFYGMSKELDQDYLDLRSLFKIVENGYKQAYTSLDNAVEGTIITIIRQWSLILFNHYNENDNVEDALIKSNDQLKFELEKTKEQLAILKKHDVVDAGAKAFTLFIDGFVNSVINDDYKIEIENNIKTIHRNENSLENIENIKYRYCTEVLIKTNLDKDAINKQVNNFGDSLVIGKSSEYYKIHIHTNEPDNFIERVAGFSIIEQSKVDDMQNQFNLSKNKLKDICIVTDSIADLPKEIIDNKNIQVLSIGILVDKMEYFDKLTINNKKIIEIVNSSKTLPKTASPSIISVIKMLENLKKYYQKIIVLNVSSKMSSTYNVFKNAALKINDPFIHIIDTKQNSVAQGLLVLKTADMVDQGYKFEEIIESIAKKTNETRILVHVNNLDNMVKGGRVVKSVGLIAKIIRLKPIVSINNDGEGFIFSKAIGAKNSITKIIKHLKEISEKNGIEYYAITHVNNLKLAESIKTRIINEINMKPVFITDSSSVIALNAGDKSVAVAYLLKE